MANNTLPVASQVSFSSLLQGKKSLSGKLSQKWGIFKVKKYSFQKKVSGNVQKYI